MAPTAILLAASESINTELIEIVGAGAAALATIGLLLVLPIFLNHRREIERLLEWKERDPDAGTTEFRAIPAPASPAGKMSPAERVTSERPALTRIATGEYALVEPEPPGFWRRVIERGPRHPLVLAILAVIVGIAAVAGASQLIRSDDSSKGGGGVDPATVQVAVVNATSEPGVGSDVAARLEARGFNITSNTAASNSAKRSAVFYGKGEHSAGKVVARVLKLPRPSPFGPEQEAVADGADVVVVAGEDGAAAGESSGSGGSGGGGKPGGGKPAGEG